MYAPVESIENASLDIFLINQINTTKNNSVSYLENPIITTNKTAYINSQTKLDQKPQNIEFVIGNTVKEYSHL